MLLEIQSLSQSQIPVNLSILATPFRRCILCINFLPFMIYMTYFSASNKTEIHNNWWNVKDLRDSEEVDDSENVVDEVKVRGVFGLRWRVGRSVASVIGRDGAKTRVRESDHLVSPRVPYLRESVKQYHHVLACESKLVIALKGKEKKCICWRIFHFVGILTGSDLGDVKFQSLLHFHELVLYLVHVVDSCWS